MASSLFPVAKQWAGQHSQSISQAEKGKAHLHLCVCSGILGSQILGSMDLAE